MNIGKCSNGGTFIDDSLPNHIHGQRVTAWLKRFAATVLLGVSLIMAGCSPQESTPVVIVEPELISENNIDGFVVNPELSADLVSPDGSHFLAVRNDGLGSYLSIFPVDPVDQEPFQDIPVESVGREWLLSSWYSYWPLGWTSDTEFLYAKVGWQPTGTHKGERGVALVVGRFDRDSATISVEEAAFFELPYSNSALRTLFVLERKQVYLNNNTTIWRFDVAQRQLTVLKSDLPDYIYRRPIPSPNGDYYVYELNEQDKSGIFIFDTTTLEEKPLIPNGDTMSFYPAWSYDGKYIAAYTVPRKEGATGTAWHDYRLFVGEDTAQSIGTSITVVDTGGNLVATIGVEDKYVQDFLWSHNDHTIGFVTSTEAESHSPDDEWLYRLTVCDSVWMARIGQASGTEATIHLGNIPNTGDSEIPPHTLPVTFDAKSEGVYCHVYRSGIWYFGQGDDPARLVDGLWPGMEAQTPLIYGDSMVALIDSGDNKCEFYLLDSANATKFGESDSFWTWIVAHTGEKLILFRGVTESGAPAEYWPYPENGMLAVFNMIKPQN